MSNNSDVQFKVENLDRYYIRSAILEVINQNIGSLNGRLLDLGCGKMPYRTLIKERSDITEYVGIDIDQALIYDEKIRPDYTWDGERLPFKDSEFDTILMTEVLEHIPNPIITIREAYRVLKNEGCILFTVPFIWPLHEVPNDEFRYTPFALKRIFGECGFSEIQIYAMGGWHASLAQMLGLWVRRSDIAESKRKLLSVILKPVIRYLIAKDIRPLTFSEGLMIPGLFGIVRKVR